MIGPPCPDWEQCMVAALAGDLNHNDTHQLEDHLSGCEECREAWTEYRRADEALIACCAVPPAVTSGGATALERARARPKRPVAATALMPLTPVGPLHVAVTDQGLCRLEFGDDSVGFDCTLREAGYTPVRDETGATTAVVEQLAAYFAGRRREFDLPVDLSGRSPFEVAVLRTTRAVEAGTVDTYAGVAAKIGRPRAYRAVGNALRHNPVPVVIPCHRVISTDGSLRGYVGGLGIKRTLLGLEGALAS